MFCEHHDDEVFTRTRAALRDVLHVASELYIGRTGHPERRLLEHRSDADRDHLLLLHWGASWDEIELFESQLISSCDHLARVQNITPESAGRYSSPWNVVYASFKLKRGVKGVPGAHDVDRLHWRLRVWPTPMVPCPMVLLRTALSSHAAQAEVDRWKALSRGRAKSRRTRSRDSFS